MLAPPMRRAASAVPNGSVPNGSVADRDAGARVDPHPHTVEIDRRVEGGEEFPGSLFGRGGGVEADQEGGEGVGPQPGDQIVGARGALESPGDLGEQAVGGEAAKSLVDLAEVVQVDEHERGHPRTGEDLGAEILQSPAIGQTREGVVPRGVGAAARELLGFRVRGGVAHRGAQGGYERAEREPFPLGQRDPAGVVEPDLTDVGRVVVCGEPGGDALPVVRARRRPAGVAAPTHAVRVPSDQHRSVRTGAEEHLGLVGREQARRVDDGRGQDGLKVGGVEFLGRGRQPLPGSPLDPGSHPAGVEQVQAQGQRRDQAEQADVHLVQLEREDRDAELAHGGGRLDVGVGPQHPPPRCARRESQHGDGDQILGDGDASRHRREG